MYIISKKSEKDYYDGVAGTTGIDKTIVYNRHIMEVEPQDQPEIFVRNFYVREKGPFRKFANLDIKKKYSKTKDVSCFIIGFCGKFYVGFKIYSVGKKTHYSWDHYVDVEITYDHNDVKEYIQENTWWMDNFNDSVQYIKNYDPTELHRLFESPIFVYDYEWNRDTFESWNRKEKLLINPILKDYSFGKVFDAVQAFQEIQMYISGVLGNKEKEIVEVADKYKIEQHGFDKWSFRKEPKNEK